MRSDCSMGFYCFVGFGLAKFLNFDDEFEKACYVFWLYFNLCCKFVVLCDVYNLLCPFCVVFVVL